MSNEHEKIYGSASPEDRLVRYRWRIKKVISEMDDPVKVFVEGRMAYTDLYEVVSSATDLDLHVDLSEIVPETLELSGLDPPEWCRQWGLVPIRLLNRGMPQIEQLTPRYVQELFHTALLDQSTHTFKCESSKYEGVRCINALTCPALVTKEVSLRTLGLLILDKMTLDPVTESEAIRHNKDVLSEFYRMMDKYKIISGAEEFDDIANEITSHLEKVFASPMPPSANHG